MVNQSSRVPISAALPVASGGKDSNNMTLLGVSSILSNLPSVPYALYLPIMLLLLQVRCLPYFTVEEPNQIVIALGSRFCLQSQICFPSKKLNVEVAKSDAAKPPRLQLY